MSSLSLLHQRPKLCFGKLWKPRKAMNLFNSLDIQDIYYLSQTMIRCFKLKLTIYIKMKINLFSWICFDTRMPQTIMCTCTCAMHLGNLRPHFVHVLSVRLQPSSTLSSYVSACAYSPPNQYGVYSGPAGGYVAPGHHHWQPQNPALSHPGGGMSMHAGEIHSPMTFKHQAREGIIIIIIIINLAAISRSLHAFAQHAVTATSVNTSKSQV